MINHHSVTLILTEFQFATDFTNEYREFIFFWIPINERLELYELL